VFVCLAYTGKNPSEADVKKMIEEIGGDGAKIDFGKFKELQKRKMPKPSDQEADIRHAFHALDRDGNGHILEAELRQLLINLGEGLLSNEVGIHLCSVVEECFWHSLAPFFLSLSLSLSSLVSGFCFPLFLSLSLFCVWFSSSFSPLSLELSNSRTLYRVLLSPGCLSLVGGAIDSPTHPVFIFILSLSGGSAAEARAVGQRR
jgi:EF-hand domain